MKVSRPGLYLYGIDALRKAHALLMIVGSGVKALVVDVLVAEVVLGGEVTGAIKYEVQPRSSKASRTSDAQAR